MKSILKSKLNSVTSKRNLLITCLRLDLIFKIDFLKSLENCLKKLLSKRHMPMNQLEKKVDQELKEIKNNLKNYEYQINEVSDVFLCFQLFSVRPFNLFTFVRVRK